MYDKTVKMSWLISVSRGQHPRALTHWTIPWLTSNSASVLLHHWQLLAFFIVHFINFYLSLHIMLHQCYFLLDLCCEGVDCAVFKCRPTTTMKVSWHPKALTHWTIPWSTSNTVYFPLYLHFTTILLYRWQLLAFLSYIYFYFSLHIMLHKC